MVKPTGGIRNGTMGRKHSQAQGWPVGRPVYQGTHAGGEDPMGLPCHDLTLSVGEPDNAAAKQGQELRSV